MVGPPFRKPFNLRAVIIFSELGFVNPVNRDMIDAIVIGISEVGLTILCFVIGWIGISWLDRKVFNKNKYKE